MNSQAPEHYISQASEKKRVCLLPFVSIRDLSYYVLSYWWFAICEHYSPVPRNLWRWNNCQYIGRFTHRLIYIAYNFIITLYHQLSSVLGIILMLLNIDWSTDNLPLTCWRSYFWNILAFAFSRCALLIQTRATQNNNPQLGQVGSVAGVPAYMGAFFELYHSVSGICTYMY